jgi:type IV pilus assembly protein PilY1
MPAPNARLLSTLAGAALALSLGMSARADDSEIFLLQPANVPQANILLIIDTSGSMNETIESTLDPYDPTFSYSNTDANCSDDRIYYSTGSTAPTSCGGLSSVRLSGNFSASTPYEIKCARAISALAWGTGATGSGFYSDRFIRWRGTGSSRAWQGTLSNNNATDMECAEDAGVHGVDASSAGKWPQQGTANQSGGAWTSTATNSWWGLAANTGLAATLYSPNYIRYLRNGPRTTRSRMDVVKTAAASLLNSMPNLNVGVMRYSANTAASDGGYVSSESAASGGMLMSPVSPLDAKRSTLISEISGATSTLYQPYGWTPLSETYFEAYRYFSGGAVQYGTAAKLCTAITNAGSNSSGQCSTPVSTYLVSHPSDALAISGSNYVSPMTQSCQKNYIVYLTDGLPTQDNEADSLITGLPNFAARGGACDASGAGRCLGALAQYMAHDDTDMRTDVDGKQQVISYFIGFGDDFAGSGLGSAFAYLQSAATKGKGQAYQANDLASLSGVFNSIITDILSTSTTFTAPTVSVNAFNRTQTLDDLYVSVFKPNTGRHWPGNLKKYTAKTEVVSGQTVTTIKDSSNPPANAIDLASGFFDSDAKSFWSATTDGADVELGGAAKRLTDPTNRNLYTYLGGSIPSGSDNTLLSAHAVSTSNSALTDTVLGIGGAGDPSRDNLINWARGTDVRNEDGDAATSVRGAMGDPMHSPPAVVTYDFTINSTTGKPENFDSVVFVTTNDGYLHAIDTDDGNELWSFIPQELLTNLKLLYFNNPVAAKEYTLDGEIRVLKYDVDGDGRVETPNDKVFLFFGMGRGGNRYYALDVTNKTAPKYLWSIGSTQLLGVGDTWSPPSIARVNIASATQNSQKLVLIVGGGYDPDQDAAIYNSSDDVGNHLYMIDALRGSVLWTAGPAVATGIDFVNSRMTHSIPGGLSVLDTNSDGFADRMYVGDMAGQVWRFDITNGNNRSSLVAGGVIASLGTKDDATAVPADARRFYNQPDVSLLQRPGEALIYNIAIGSGYRGHPLNTVVHDRFYSLRDPQPFRVLTQAQYDDTSVVPLLRDSGLTDVTDPVVTSALPAGSAGWKLTLNLPTWRGEKSLSSSTTFNNVIQFTTFTPPATTTSTLTCTVTSTGTNRVYTIDAFNGAPIRRDTPVDTDGDGDVDADDDNAPDPEDRYEDLAQGGIAPQVSYLFPENNTVVCLAGVEVLNTCRSFNSRIKTYWRETNAP